MDDLLKIGNKLVNLSLVTVIEFKEKPPKALIHLVTRETVLVEGGTGVGQLKHLFFGLGENGINVNIYTVAE